MDNEFLLQSGKDFEPDPQENVLSTLFKQYEGVVVESLISSFGLNFIMGDQYGGDVDTLQTVRDPQAGFKNKKNEAAYNARGDYDSNKYHGDAAYRKKNAEISAQKKAGNLVDGYTGEKIKRNEKSDLDHVISAKEIHDDPARTLAGLNGVELANSDENLVATNPHTNRTKKADSMEEFHKKHGDEYTEEQKQKMREIDENARKEYNKKLAKAYYTSPRFLEDTAKAATNTAAKMGIKQAMGFVLTEVWFSVKAEILAYIKEKTFEMSEMFKAIGRGVKKGFESAKSKYKKIIEKFKDGAIAGAISSLTNTLCNIFASTTKNAAKIIRETYSSIVQAAKILFFNPENLPFGERMRAVAKILATGASIIVGSLVSELIGKSALGAIPIIGGIVQTFCGTMTTGILTCSLLFFLDRCPAINYLVKKMNALEEKLNAPFNYYRDQAAFFEQKLAELEKIDLQKFKKETSCIESIANSLESASTEEELNEALKQAFVIIGVKLDWGGYDDFDDFMADKDAVLVFD